MNTLAAIITATVIFGSRILYLVWRKTRKVMLYPVEAGPLTEAHPDLNRPMPVCVGNLKMNRALHYFVVKNDCMIPKEIRPDDIIGVRMFDENFTVENVEEGKILLIYLPEKEIYKMRIKGEPAEDNAYNTYYYRNNEKTKSSRPHGADSIKGVVVEVNHRV